MSRHHHHRNVGGIVVGILFLIAAALVVYFIFFNNSGFLQPDLPIPVVSVAANWAGYVAGSNLFFPQSTVTAVSASWTVPTVTDVGADAHSSVWVGVGGLFDSSLIQVGTEQDYVNGAPKYWVWYEMLPNFQVPIDSMQLSPGDQIHASVSLKDADSNMWTISIQDLSTGQSFQQDFQYASQKLTAEWIVERPSINGQLTNLADFGSLTFTSCQATISGRTGGITDFADNRVFMEPTIRGDQQIQLVNVSGVSGGSEFSVDYIAGP